MPIMIRCRYCSEDVTLLDYNSHTKACGEKKYGSSPSSPTFTSSLLSDISIPKLDMPKFELPKIETPKTIPFFDYTSTLTKKKEETPISMQSVDLSFLTKKKEEKKPIFPSFDYSSIFTKKEPKPSFPSIDVSSVLANTGKKEEKPKVPMFDATSFLGDLRKRQEEGRDGKETEDWSKYKYPFLAYLVKTDPNYEVPAEHYYKNKIRKFMNPWMDKI